MGPRRADDAVPGHSQPAPHPSRPAPCLPQSNGDPHSRFETSKVLPIDKAPLLPTFGGLGYRFPPVRNYRLCVDQSASLEDGELFREIREGGDQDQGEWCHTKLAHADGLLMRFNCADSCYDRPRRRKRNTSSTSLSRHMLGKLEWPRSLEHCSTGCAIQHGLWFSRA